MQFLVLPMEMEMVDKTLPLELLERIALCMYQLSALRNMLTVFPNLSLIPSIRDHFVTVWFTSQRINTCSCLSCWHTRYCKKRAAQMNFDQWLFISDQFDQLSI